MNNTVWKYTFQPTATFDVKMQKGAKILKVDRQHGLFKLWALVDPEVGKEYRFFRIVGTGYALPENEIQDLEYIDTFQMDGGTYVFHLFERKV